LPEGVDEEDWVVPSILAGSVSCSGCFHVDVLSDSWMDTGILHDSSVWDERHSEVGMIVRIDDWSSGDFLFLLFLISHILFQ
jgi:hypothetical protein